VRRATAVKHGLMAVCTVGIASGLAAQPSSRIGFEVVSIRHIEYTDAIRNEVLSGTRRPRMLVTDGRVSITYMSLAEILRNAFRLEPWAIAGPEWLNDVRVDIQATMPPGAKTEQVPEMLQALLAQRFALVVRRESREVSGQALVAKGKVGVRELTPEQLAEIARQRETARFDARTIRTESSTFTFTPRPDGQIQADIRGMSMSELARELTVAVGTPVVDRTGLGGRYEFTLELPLTGLPQLTGGASAGPAAGASDPRGMFGSMVEAVQRLGLSLEPARIPIDVLVIDKVSRTATPD
jgi:uncharacterized protein (TIGR03435 family)